MKIFTSKRIGAILLIAAASGAVGYVANAQTGAQRDNWESDYVIARMRYDTLRMSHDDAQAQFSEQDKVATLLQAAVSKQPRTNTLAKNWTVKPDSTAESNAFIVLQNQRLIQQNEQIIALLKAKK